MDGREVNGREMLENWKLVCQKLESFALSTNWKQW